MFPYGRISSLPSPVSTTVTCRRASGDEIERHARRVRDRLVFVPHELGSAEVAVVDHDFVPFSPDRRPPAASSRAR
jgi:hypothetical protein